VTEKLTEILEKGRSQFFLAVKSCRLVGLWSRVVEEKISKNTEAVKIRNRILYVNTSSSTWAQQLTFLKRQIITKFNKTAGEEAIKDIHFKASGEKIGGRP
jgi:predicted nucleic acid-binding Zn ribbon protein